MIPGDLTILHEDNHLLAVLKPGMRETEVSAWGNFVARHLGAEEFGFDMVVNTGLANRSLIGKSLNNTIQTGDMVQLGIGPKRDGLASCVRRSVVMLEPGEKMPENFDEDIPAVHRRRLDN